MQFLRILLLFFLVSGLFVGSRGQADVLGSRCGEIFLNPSQFPLEDSASLLNLIPGSSVKEGYHHPKLESRLEEIFLVVRSEEEIPRIAEILAVGQEAKTVKKRIRKFLAKNPESTELRIPLSELLPPYSKRRANTRAWCNGPNCYHAAANFFGRYWPTRLSYRYPEIFSDFYSDKERFRELKPNEPMRYGDMIVIASHGPRHAMIYIGNRMVFHKPSLYKESIYTFETLESAGALYHVDGERENLRPLIRVFRKVRTDF